MSDITSRLRELAHAVADQRWSEFSMRVPADFERDADLVLMRAADEIAQLRAENARLIGDHAAALRLVADVRAAIGDDGRRMQPELIEYCKAMKSRAGKGGCRVSADRYEIEDTCPGVIGVRLGANTWYVDDDQPEARAIRQLLADLEALTAERDAMLKVRESGNG